MFRNALSVRDVLDPFELDTFALDEGMERG